MDNILRAFGISIHPWKDAMYSALSGFFIASIMVPVLWRVGLVTGPLYVLGGLSVFVPATLLSVLAIAWFDSIIVTVPGFEDMDSRSQVWAMTAYIRTARSAILFPIYIFFFWLTFHCLFAMAPLTIWNRRE
ncbi:MAG: hypothetical protein ACK5NN_06390 [Sphingomonadaceae bacterium]